MPDISMCGVKDCRRSRQCYRNEDSGTKPSHQQSWAAFKAYPNGYGCSCFWPTPNPRTPHDADD